MKIDNKTRQQMAFELEAAFSVIDQCEPGCAKQRFIEASDYNRVGYWIKAHQWSSLPKNLNDKQKAIFRNFPQNQNHELYPCRSNDSSLSTALRAIANKFKGNT